MPQVTQMTETLIDFNLPGRVLTAAQKQAYNKNGYIVIRNCVPRHEIQRYLQRFYEICDGINVPLDMTVACDVMNAKLSSCSREKSVSKLRDINHDPVLFDYCQHPNVVDIVNDLIGLPNDRILAMHGMLINKPPDTGNLGSRHPVHQDLIYFPFRPADYIVGAWTAMEKVAKRNGCLEVIPGSHRLGNNVRDHDYPKWDKGVNPAYFGIQDFDPNSSRLLHVEMEAGDTIFFHPLLFHGSGVNRTNGYRKAISCHYANGDRCMYIDLKGTNQEGISRMALSLMRKQFLKNGNPNKILTYIDYFKSQARSVSEKRAHL